MWQVFNTHTGQVVAELPWRWMAHAVAVLSGREFDYDPA